MKIKWSWVDYVLAIFRIAFLFQCIVYVIATPEDVGGRTEVLVLWILISMLVPHIFWRPGTVHKEWFIITELLLSSSLYFYFTFYLQLQTQASFLIMPALVTGHLATKKTVIIVPVTLFALSLCMFWHDTAIMDYLTQFFLVIMMYGFGFSFNKMLSTQQKIRTLLAENENKNKLIETQNRALEQYSKKIEEFTLQTERNRLAGELHDTIGHTLTSVIVGMDAVNLLMDRDTNKAKEKLALLRNVTASGLDNFRQQIHEIAVDEQELSLSSVLEHIKVEFAEYTSTEVSWNVQGNEYKVSKHVKLVLSRCLQESLTNAKRHGEATEIKVNLEFKSNEIILTISDNGKGSEKVSFGFGLKGMRDRLSTLQGDLQVHTELGTGTTVTCYVPVREMSHGEN